MRIPWAEMTDVLAEPGVWGILAVTAVAGLVRWLWRREPWWIVALAVLGIWVFYVGVRWAGNIDSEALLAAGLASVGLLLAAQVEHIGARRRDNRKSSA
jgi:4-amino-4-deoxy-L-arabinose transferase-like glycosyltransferase